MQSTVLNSSCRDFLVHRNDFLLEWRNEISAGLHRAKRLWKISAPTFVTKQPPDSVIAGCWLYTVDDYCSWSISNDTGRLPWWLERLTVCSLKYRSIFRIHINSMYGSSFQATCLTSEISLECFVCLSTLFKADPVHPNLRPVVHWNGALVIVRS